MITKMTEGLVTQLFTDDGDLLSQDFTCTNTVVTLENGKPLADNDPGLQFEAPYTMFQPRHQSAIDALKWIVEFCGEHEEWTQENFGEGPEAEWLENARNLVSKS